VAGANALPVSPIVRECVLLTSHVELRALSTEPTPESELRQGHWTRRKGEGGSGKSG
jgi:hypothetical protein